MPRTRMFDQVGPLFRESEQDLDRGAWILDAADRDLISHLLPSLDALALQRADHPASDRSPIVLDAIADLASTTGRATRRLAWLLLGTTRALEPVLHHSAAPPGASDASADPRLADAEHVLLRLRTLLRLARCCQVAHP